MSEADPADGAGAGGPPRLRTDRRVAGILMIVVSACGVLFFSLLALLAANPCGAFGDACDEVGGVGDGFGWLALLVVACLIGIVVGIAMLASTRSD